eukprot:3258855-Lingulodinium_polyedra.AAC.1
MPAALRAKGDGAAQNAGACSCGAVSAACGMSSSGTCPTAHCVSSGVLGAGSSTRAARGGHSWLVAS